MWVCIGMSYSPAEEKDKDSPKVSGAAKGCDNSVQCRQYQFKVLVLLQQMGWYNSEGLQHGLWRWPTFKNQKYALISLKTKTKTNPLHCIETLSKSILVTIALVWWIETDTWKPQGFNPLPQPGDLESVFVSHFQSS